MTQVASAPPPRPSRFFIDMPELAGPPLSVILARRVLGWGLGQLYRSRGAGAVVRFAETVREVALDAVLANAPIRAPRGAELLPTRLRTLTPEESARMDRPCRLCELPECGGHHSVVDFPPVADVLLRSGGCL